jgi:hypothetical protein
MPRQLSRGEIVITKGLKIFGLVRLETGILFGRSLGNDSPILTISQHFE